LWQHSGKFVAGRSDAADQLWANSPLLLSEYSTPGTRDDRGAGRFWSDRIPEFSAPTASYRVKQLAKTQRPVRSRLLTFSEKFQHSIIPISSCPTGPVYAPSNPHIETSNHSS